MNKLKTEKDLLGKKIDLNWLKYKIRRNRRYLEKLNWYIGELVKVDQAIARQGKPPRPIKRK